MGINTNLIIGMFDTIKNAAIAEESWPNVNFDGNETPYLQIDLIPAGNFSLGLQLNSLEGYLQVKVVVEQGTGLIDGYIIADLIVDLFPVGLRIQEETTEIIIESKSFISPAIINGDNQEIPVSIPYTVIN